MMIMLILIACSCSVQLINPTKNNKALLFVDDSYHHNVAHSFAIFNLNIVTFTKDLAILDPKTIQRMIIIIHDLIIIIMFLLLFSQESNTKKRNVLNNSKKLFFPF